MTYDCQIETVPSPRPRGKKVGTGKKRRAKTAVAEQSSRGKNSKAAAELAGERYTPLLTREAYTFSRMRIDRGGPLACSAICFPGWTQA